MNHRKIHKIVKRKFGIIRSGLIFKEKFCKFLSSIVYSQVSHFSFSHYNFASFLWFNHYKILDFDWNNSYAFFSFSELLGHWNTKKFSKNIKKKHHTGVWKVAQIKYVLHQVPQITRFFDSPCLYWFLIACPSTRPLSETSLSQKSYSEVVWYTSNIQKYKYPFSL